METRCYTLCSLAVATLKYFFVFSNVCCHLYSALIFFDDLMSKYKLKFDTQRINDANLGDLLSVKSLLF